MRVMHTLRGVLRFPGLSGIGRNKGERKMALVAHNNVVSVGDVLGSEYLGITSGFKVLSKVFVEGVDEYMYVVQYGDFKKGETKFSPYGDGKDLNVMSMKDITLAYSKKWTKEPEVKDGDVLRSSDCKHIFVVRGTHQKEPKLYRVSGGADLFDRLSNYEATYGKLTVMTAGYNEKRRFSTPVTAEDHTGTSAW